MNVKTTYILAVLVLIGGLLLLIEQPWKGEPQTPSAEPGSTLQAVFDPTPETEAIDRLEISPAGADKLAFVRTEDDKYQIVDPLDAPAVDYYVRNAVEAVTEMKAKRSYAKSDGNRPSADEAGLNPPAFVVRFHEREKNRTTTVHVGKTPPLSGDTYIQVEGRDELLVVQGRLADSLGKPVDDFRNKSLLTHLRSSDIQRLRVEGVRSYELTRSGDGWLMEAPIRARADKIKADAVASAAATLVARKFVDDEPAGLARYGLESPALKVVVYAEKKVEKPAEIQPEGAQPDQAEPTTQPTTEIVKQEATILIGGPAGDDYFAKLADKPWVFTIPSSTFKSFSPELFELRDKSLVSFEKDKVTRIELAVGGESGTLEKVEQSWQMGEVKAELLAIDDLLKSARDLKATSFADEGLLEDPGLDNPRAALALTVTGQEAPIRLEIGNPTSSGEMVYVRNPASEGVAVVRKDEVANFLRSPVAYRSRDMLSFGKALANLLVVERDGQRWAAEKVDEKWLLTEPLAEEAESQAIADSLSDLYSLRGRTVVGVGNLADFGLDAPEITVTVRYQPLPEPVEIPSTQPATTQEAETQPASAPAWIEKPPVTHVLRVARREDKVYATVDDGGIICEIDAKIHDNLRAELLDRRVARFEISQVVGVTFSGGDGAVELSRVGDAWSYAEDPALPIDPKKVTEALDKLRELKTHRFVTLGDADPAEYGLEETTLKVRLTLDDHSTIDLAVSERGPEGDADGSRYAHSSASGRVFLMKPDQLAALTKAIGDFKKTESAPSPPAAAPRPPLPPIED